MKPIMYVEIMFDLNSCDFFENNKMKILKI